MFIFILLIMAGVAASLGFIRYGRMVADARYLWFGRIGLYICVVLLAIGSKSMWLSIVVTLVGLGKLVMDWWKEKAEADNYGLGEAGEEEPGTDYSAKPLTGKLSRREALQVLGLEEPVSAEDIDRAWKTLIAKNHPDRGGTDWMAAKINEARERLLH